MIYNLLPTIIYAKHRPGRLEGLKTRINKPMNLLQIRLNVIWGSLFRMLILVY